MSKKTESQQLNLFEDRSSSLSPGQKSRVMDKEALRKWKQRIFEYQNQERKTQPPQQQTLFEIPKNTWQSVEDIDPFALRIHPSLFWRLPEPGAQLGEESEQGCLYFIIDNTLPILLYVGETKLSAKKRWSGVHYCKDYMANYIQLHRIHQLEVAVVSAFWSEIPSEKKVLLEWERELIRRWRSPFNKESWTWWGQPFGKEWK